METYKLRRPIEFEGETVTELRLNLDDLSAKDMFRCKKEALALPGSKDIMLQPHFDERYVACVAAKSAGVVVDLILALYLNDFTQLCIKVQSFLLAGESAPEETGSSPEAPSPETESDEPRQELNEDYQL